MKRIVCIFLLLTLTLTTLACTVSAAGEEFQIEDGVLVAYTGNAKSVTVPSSVTDIGFEAFAGCSSITQVAIPSGVKGIYADAFANCPNLTSVTIREGVSSISTGAFRGCDALTRVSIPQSVVYIGPGAFEATPFNDKLTDEFVVLGSVLYRYNGQGGRVTIPGNVVTIADYAFAANNSITDVFVPPSITHIGEKAFWGCTNLENVLLPISIKEIGFEAFDATPFMFRNSQNDFVILGGMLYAYNGSSENVAIPSGVLSIGYAAFYDRNFVKQIDIPYGVAEIGQFAFAECTRLERVTFPETLLSIGFAAFENCHNLLEISIPDSVASIDTRAFAGCTGLRSVELPRNINVAIDAFEGAAVGSVWNEEQEREAVESLPQASDSQSLVTDEPVQNKDKLPVGVIIGAVAIGLCLLVAGAIFAVRNKKKVAMVPNQSEIVQQPKATMRSPSKPVSQPKAVQNVPAEAPTKPAGNIAVVVRCPHCDALCGESAKFCKECGGSMVAGGTMDGANR